MLKEYFAYDDDTGLDTFKTEAEAKEAAENSIEYYRDEAAEGWDDAASNVCWGKLSQRSEMFKTGKRVIVGGASVEHWDYKMIEI